jgi:hypothetical protein
MIENMTTPQANSGDSAPSFSRKLLDEVLAKDDLVRKQRAEAVAAAKAANSNKEPFSTEALGQHYSLRELGVDVSADPEVVAEYEADYYLKHPEVNTLSEFAKALKLQDAHEAN